MEFNSRITLIQKVEYTMVSKNLLIILSAIFFSYGQTTPGAVDSFVNANSSHLLGLVGDYNIIYHNEIKQYLSKPFTTNDSLKLKVLPTFIGYATFLSETHSRDAFLIQDEIMFQLCIYVMANYYGKYCADEAFDELCKYGRFDYLIKYSEDIKRALAGKKKIGDSQVENLLCLLNLSGEEKKKLLETKYLPGYVRARLGDTTAENGLIKEFLNANTKDFFYVRKRVVDELGTVATPNSIRFLIKVFNDTIYESGCQGKRSIAAYIIPKLGRLHPDNQMLMHYPHKATPEEVKDYLVKVIEWMKKTYGVAPDNSEPLPFIAISGICR